MTAPPMIPDTRWIAAVHGMMATIGTKYLDASATRRRELAGAVVAQLSLALDELGVFDGDAAPAQEAIAQLLVMVRDLESGRKHPWSEPTNFGGTRSETRGDREVRLWSIVAVELLMLTRAGSKEAVYRRVQDKVQSAGHRFASVKKWYTTYQKDGSPSDVGRVAEMVSERAASNLDMRAVAEAFLTDPESMLPWLIEQS